jgi:dihydroxyacetone kinase-like protein
MAELTIDIEKLKTILKAVASDLKSHADELRELDAKAGDGDLGVTIELAGKGMADYLGASAEPDPGKLLAQCGLTINKVSPSTFGTILASGFMVQESGHGNTCPCYGKSRRCRRRSCRKHQKTGQSRSRR